MFIGFKKVLVGLNAVLLVLRACSGTHRWACQGSEKHTSKKEYFPETGFDVLPAGPGRRATSHD